DGRQQDHDGDEDARFPPWARHAHAIHVPPYSGRRHSLSQTAKEWGALARLMRLSMGGVDAPAGQASAISAAGFGNRGRSRRSARIPQTRQIQKVSAAATK